MYVGDLRIELRDTALTLVGDYQIYGQNGCFQMQKVKVIGFAQKLGCMVSKQLPCLPHGQQSLIVIASFRIAITEWNCHYGVE